MLDRILINEELMDSLRTDLEMIFEEHGLCDKSGKFMTNEEFMYLTDQEVLDCEINIWGIDNIINSLMIEFH